MPLQNSSEKTAVADTQKKLPAEEQHTQALKFHHHTRKEASFSVSKYHDALTTDVSKRKGLAFRMSESKSSAWLKQHKEPADQQYETEQQNAPCDQEHFCNTGDHELPRNRQRNQ